jgi:putative transposase
MRTAQTTLTADDVQGYAHGLLSKHLRLPDRSPRVTAGTVYAAVLYAAATASTIAHACRSLFAAPSKTALYNALDATLPRRAELQRRLNAALRGSVPKAVRNGKRPAKLAIDLNLVPYYGEPDRDDDMVYVGQEKASTHHHHAYATVYLVRKAQRFTLGLMMVRHDTPWD